jgi:hypothetical protein
MASAFTLVERPRRARALVAFWVEHERDERFLGMDLIDPVRRHKTHYQILSATHLKV